MQDLEPWYDADGYEHRNALDLKAIKVEFETPAMLTESEFLELMGGISKNYTVPRARQFLFSAYIPEYGIYPPEQTGYLADFQPQIYGTYGGIIRYNPVRFAIIGGVYSG